VTAAGIRPQVKICGIREEQTILAMAGMPVDLIGFVFAPSKRQVTAEKAARLCAVARGVNMNEGRPPRAVGVFVDPTLEELERALAQAPLDIVQLHGRETPAFCRQVRERFGVEVWRAFPVEERETDPESGLTGAERLAKYEGAVSAVLLDTAGGGTGRTFRWALIPSYQARARAHGQRLFIAGGLTPDNVSGLLASCLPDGVDISSGVETDGAKDIRKIAAFAERVKRP
jgi:phosphoribosylanthranilate isomerase